MTCREKLAIEHPEEINDNVPGGCLACPDLWGYLDRPDYCGNVGSDNCQRCWDREIPETDICSCYSAMDYRCNGAKERDECSCEGDESRCDFYPEKREKAIQHIVDKINEVGNVNAVSPEEVRNIIKKKPTLETVMNVPYILDSGTRREFETGAVRDIQEGKGRMDLLPWGAIMEVSKHCEAGANKYGEHNVDKGIPTHSLCDSAARHLAKYLDGWDDEPHLLAAAWNLLWAIQMELKHKELVDTPWMKYVDNTKNT